MINHKDYLYDYAKFPRYPEFVARIAAAASMLSDKLANLSLDSLPISDYNRRYFGRYLRNREHASEHVTHLLAWALAFHERDPRDLVMIDYGGGSGFSSLLAKQVGIGTVIYNDIYNVSCSDAQAIGSATNLSASHYVCGDVEGLLGYLHTHSLQPNAVISFDTIEHIYNIDVFLDKICNCSTEPLSLTLASSANTLNPRTRWLTMALHRRKEYQHASSEWGHKERDTLLSFLHARRKIIQERFPQLGATELDELAARTRGLIKCDIIQRVESYLDNRILPVEPEHPTNTCDPFTGNWAEHLMDPAELLNRIESHGFEGCILAGYYGRYKTPVKQWLTRALNLVIANSGSLGLRLAPHYIIHARNF